MEPLSIVRAVAAPLMQPNIDTDRIIRIERVAGVARDKLGPYMLEQMRFRADGSENPDCILNRDPWRGAKILVAGQNFGCGSSREDAVWAIAGYGVRVVIAPSFGDIFFSNCFQNGVLPIRLGESIVEDIAAEVASAGSAELTVDLPAQVVNTAGGGSYAFDIEPRRKQMLIEGADEIGMTLKLDAKIAAFQRADRQQRPWLYPT